MFFLSSVMHAGRFLYHCLSEFRFQLLPLCIQNVHCARACVYECVSMRVCIVVWGGVNDTYEKRTYDRTKDSQTNDQHIPLLY